MSTIDLTQGSRTFRVSTKVVRQGVGYMGPDVLVTARNEEHAREVTHSHGHVPNEHFPPIEVKEDR